MAGSDHRGIYWPQTVFQHLDFKLVIRLKEAGTPQSLVSDLFHAKVIESEGSSTVIKDLAPVVYDPADGVVMIDLAGANANYSPATNWWYFRQYDASEDDWVNLFYGPYTIHPYAELP